MNIYHRVKLALAPVGLPVFRGYWKPTKEYPELPSMYIVVLRLIRRPELGADDHDVAFGHYLRVDVYGNRAVDAEVDAARAALDAAGFCVGEDRELTDEQAQDYHTSISVIFYVYEEGNHEEEV